MSDTRKAAAAVKPQETELGMGSLFADTVREDLMAYDIMTMTPIEALNALYKLQQQAKKEAGQA